jgi:hypothetical protein
MKSKTTGCGGTSRANRKSASPVVKNKKVKNGQHCSQHSGDVAVLAWQDKKHVSVISTCCKDEMRVAINK